MPKTGNFYHEIQDLTDVSATNAFAALNRHDINLYDTNIGSVPQQPGSPFFGKLEGMVARVKSIAGGATKITIKITHNQSGQQVIIPDTEATIALEVGSTTEGGFAVKFDFPYVHDDDQLHIFYKTDAGTATIDAIELYWSE